MVLNTIDLFSGIGGITHALEGIAEPIAYCDWAEESREVLSTLMKRGKLPRAPICSDVRELTAAWLSKNVADAKAKLRENLAIVGGFPCIGFSPMGLRQGFDHDESGLFSEILRLTDLLRPKLLFLENVPNVVKLGMDHVAHELAEKRGYELRWAVAPAEIVGAPHRRARWFCMAVKPGFECSVALRKAYRAYPWGKQSEPPRAVVATEGGRGNRTRVGQLGNAVVPDAVRYAFLYLSARGDAERCAFESREWRLSRASKKGKAASEEVHPPSGGTGTWPTSGILLAGGGRFEKLAQPPRLRDQHREELVFDPAAFTTHKKPSTILSSGYVEAPVVRFTWATPRHSATGATNYLTQRSMRDLPTQVRFERGTPDALRHGALSAEFVEYLMGFPIGWTLA